ncbi:hypothetical protein WJX77_000942 [Trebouxia sp. C0004]
MMLLPWLTTNSGVPYCCPQAFRRYVEGAGVDCFLAEDNFIYRQMSLVNTRCNIIEQLWAELAKISRQNGSNFLILIEDAWVDNA